MAVPCARVSNPLVSRIRRSSAQTPDGKGRRNTSGLLGRRSPSAAPRQPPTSGSSCSKCRNFSQALNPASHRHGGSPPAAVATPGSWRCT